jgi:hypothetical protein
MQLVRPLIGLLAGHALPARNERADELDQVITVGIRVVTRVELRDNALLE